MTRTVQKIDLPQASFGTDRHLTVWRWGEAEARPKVYIHAGLHADEWPGMMAANHLATMLDEAQSQGNIVGEIIMLPYANPIGLSQYMNDHMLGRYRLADGGGNFNRGWPDMAEACFDKLMGKLGDDTDQNIKTVRSALLEAVSELPDDTEAAVHKKALLSLSIDADYILDLHCDWNATLHLFAHQEHTDIIMEMASDLGSPVVLLDTGLVGGPFDETHANAWIKIRQHFDLSAEALPPACFATTVEFRGHGDVSDEYGHLDASNLLKFLKRRKVIAGDPGPCAAAPCEATRLDACDMFRAPCAGLVAWKKTVGDHVNVGDHLADIIDITQVNPSKARTPIYSTQNGLLFSTHSDRMTRPGEIMGKVAGKEPLAHRQQGGSLLSNK